MKREIKFRGKDLNGEGWIYGSYLLTDDNENNPYISSRRIKQKHQIVQYNAGDWGMGGWAYYDVDPESIGQYTGLKDKNGVEIYEGDIFHLVDKNITYTTVWHDTGLIGKQNGTSNYVGLEHWKKHIEIIGNIHDNPELLK